LPAAALIASAVAGLLKMFIQQAGMTNEAHSFSALIWIETNCRPAPGAANFKLWIMITLIPLQLNYSLLVKNLFGN
jgi:hypothetical protein